jgi:hypothetical protein
MGKEPLFTDSLTLTAESSGFAIRVQAPGKYLGDWKVFRLGKGVVLI